MKEFNLEEAKNGAHIITRSGKKVRILCFDRIDQKKKGHIMALVSNDKNTWEMPVFYHLDGSQVDFIKEYDLMIQE